MVAVTLQILKNTHTHNLSTQKKARRIVMGDIIAIYPRINVPPSPNSNCYFIHINNMPNKLARRTKLALENYDYFINELGEPDSTFISKRRFFIKIPHIPLSIRRRLIADRECTITWNQIKGKIHDKKTRLVLDEGDIE